MSFPIIGKRFTPDEFDAYVAGITLSTAFRPKFVVLHNTASPSLAQRPNGFSEQNMEDLRDFYSGKGWSGSPHCFIDDTEAGIWVLNPLDRRGTHSPTFNSISYGIECLGDYDSELWNSGRGALVRANAVRAAAALCRKMDVLAATIKLHREDPATTHACPGKNVEKADFVARVAAALNASAPPPNHLSPQWLVQFPNGEKRTVDASQTGLVRWVAERSGASVAVSGKVIAITPRAMGAVKG